MPVKSLAKDSLTLSHTKDIEADLLMTFNTITIKKLSTV